MAFGTGFGGFNSSSQSSAGTTSSGFGTGQTTGGGLGTTAGFGTSSFGSASTPAFGAGTSTSAFGQPSVFGQSSSTAASGQSNPTPAFGGGTSTPGLGSGSGFGASSTSSFGLGSSTSAFGSTSAPGTLPSAFGAAASTSAFGQTTPAPAFGAATSTSAFGGATSAPAFGSSFGVTSSTSAFGQNSTGLGSGFGAATSASAFGQSGTSTTFGSNTFGGAFGAGQSKVTAAPLGTGFGASQNTMGTFSTERLGGGNPTQVSAFDALIIQKALEKIGLVKPPETTPSVLEQCIGIQQSLDSKSQNYLFQSFFYNLIHPSQVNTFAEPTDHPGYQKAVKENPDSRCMVPVLSTGPDGLKERCKAQRAQTALHRLALKKIGEKLEAVAKTQTLALKSRLDKIQHRQEGLKHRISSLNQLALLMAQRGAPLRPEEEELHRQLKEIQSKMMSPDDFDKFKKQIQLLLQEQSDYIDTLTANYKANPSNFNKDAKAAIKETIEINTRALDALKVQLAGGLQLDKYFRKNGKFLPGAT